MNQNVGINQIYKKESKISKLPEYVVVQMQRFFWKGESAVAGTKATKTKILRNVAFPLVLDLFNYCNDDLKKNLKVGRDYEIRQRQEEDERILSGKAIEEEEKKEGPPKKKEKVKEDLINDKILY